MTSIPYLNFAELGYDAREEPMQFPQRKPRLHKFVSGIIACILVLTNILEINPLASTTVAYAQDSGGFFTAPGELD